MNWNLGDILEGVESAVPPENDALIHGDRTISWGELAKRSNNLIRHFQQLGLQPGDKIAFYLRNQPAYMESVVVCFKGRFVHTNINYRYTDEELLYILDNSDAAAVIFDEEFASRVEDIRDRAGKVKHWINVCEDASRDIPGGHNYEALALDGDGAPVAVERSPDDLLFIYTGGTTGMPKGVMWRHEDFFYGTGGGAIPAFNISAPKDLAGHVSGIQPIIGQFRQLVGSPLMHGMGLISAIVSLMWGGTVITLTKNNFDAKEAWQVVTRNRATAMAIVGDVFARPLLRALQEDDGQYELSSMGGIVSSGVMWSKEVKQGLLEYLPQVVLTDGFSSSEAFGIAASVTTKDGESEAATFAVGRDCKVFSEDFREIKPGSDESGLIARSGPIPVGYYKDPEKTAKTFPTIDGVRYTMPGDWCTVAADGTLTLLGRGSVCINTGGEKVYPEEVEEALKLHSSVDDTLVVGLPDEKWGQRIVAVVQLAANFELDELGLKNQVREALAGYKVPKEIFIINNLGRGPNGKADYKAITAYAVTRSAGAAS
jgi:acyl-CoA synthetase (AMP-forming)/AMP-acid ligase II